LNIARSGTGQLLVEMTARSARDDVVFVSVALQADHSVSGLLAHDQKQPFGPSQKGLLAP
jgi:hypothetical protein